MVPIGRSKKGTRHLLQVSPILAEVRTPLFVLIIVVPLLAVASFVLHREVTDNADFGRALRDAQHARGATLRLQLDEEAGIRGFTSTGDRRFLEPFFVARKHAGEVFAHLNATLQGVGLDDSLSPAERRRALKIAGKYSGNAFARLNVTLNQSDLGGALPFSDRQQALNALWLSRYAEPLIADPNRSPRTAALEIEAKALVDEFRFIDGQIEARLNIVAAEADARSERAVSAILIVNAVVLTTLIVASIGFGYLQSRTAQRAFEAHVRYENEKRIAGALQEAFVQKSLPFLPGVGLHATYVPASSEAQIGGDWYDAFELPDKRILFSIGDVAGHGIEAAVVMNRARQSIVSAALGEDDPAAVLLRANRALLLQDSRMVTAICGYLDPRSRDIVYATAGHPAPVMARPGAAAELLPHSGLPLGIVEEPEYIAFHARAEAGSLLVLYTDGVLEHKRDLLEGQARLLEAAARAVGSEDPAIEIQRRVFEDSPPTDDVAILAISFSHVPGDGDVLSVSSLQLSSWQPGSIREASVPEPESGAHAEITRTA